MARKWNPDAMDTLMLLAPRTATLGYQGHGDFGMDDDGLVRRPRSEEEVPFVFTGVSIAHPRLFENAPEGKFSLNVLWDEAIASGRAYGLRHEGIWMHVGTPEALREAEECIAREQG
jgi:MurNAc alpha-1-phosphate uridylyltransferase